MNDTTALIDAFLTFASTAIQPSRPVVPRVFASLRGDFFLAFVRNIVHVPYFPICSASGSTLHILLTRAASRLWTGKHG
jgi:hypothetical protein